MRRIILENFRCYKNQEFAFRPGVNLLIGDNASGKTSVLKACKYVLSAFFSGFSDENTRWISPTKEDFSIVSQNGIIAPEKPIRIHFENTKSQFPVISQNTLENVGSSNSLYTIEKKTSKNSKALTKGLMGFKHYSLALQTCYTVDLDGKIRHLYPLPLFASFSTEDIHSNRRIDKKRFAKYSHKRSFGYYECMQCDGFLPYWQKRLLSLKEGQKSQEEIDIVTNAIKTALGDEGCGIICDMSIRPINKQIYYITTDGREIETSLLSDGYKRLVNIVTDVAFRCAILNRAIHGTSAAENTYGTVLVDEIDMHLHPSLQSKVIKGLRKAFPNIQFVLTTHAPMVMTGVENNDDNVVYKLCYSTQEGFTVKQVNTYGLDVSTITEIILDQLPRDEKVNMELTDLFGLIDDEKYSEAKDKLDAMEKRYRVELPEFSRAKSMLNFLQP